MKIKRKTDPHLKLIEKALGRSLPPRALRPREVHGAMRYAVLNGGKRFRPRLVLAACEAVGGRPEQALLPACAVELVHCYSLVHDDLPALDNDALRRGMPSCHKKYGEAIAILTGDALLTRAFQLLGSVRPAGKAISLIHELSKAAGTDGMIGGQAADLQFSSKTNGVSAGSRLNTLDYISRNKTGRLIEASAVMGAISGARPGSNFRRIQQFGAALGLAFQVADDIMDRDGYLRMMSVDEAREKVQTLIRKAKQHAASFKERGRRLFELADFLLSTVRET